MNKTTLCTVLGLGAIALGAAYVILAPKADATIYARSNPTDVIPPDWVGRWNCNLDGRAAVIEFKLGNDIRCNGNVCSTTAGTKLVGRISDNGGEWKPLEQRNFTPSDPPTTRQDHLLPLRYNNTDNWMLMMHTWNRNFASGYTVWNGIPFGLQCRKS